MVDLDTLTDTVQSLQLALTAANADLELLNRLKSAETDANGLMAELAKAQDQLTTAMADEVAAKRALTFSRFGRITVAVSLAEQRPNSAIAATYTINVEKIAYDGDLRQSVPMTLSYTGFPALPSDVYEYLVTVKPKALPAIILALAPGDPAAAMNVYWDGLRRGYLAG